MHEILVDVEHWLSQRPKWLQNAASRLVRTTKLSDKDIQELIELCKMEVDSDRTTKESTTLPLKDIFSKSDTKYLRLVSIGEVKGINALNPRKPLQFGSGQLTIVYGQNGSGKSSYVKLLKHVCGGREPGKLIGNVFQEEAVQKQECTIVYNDGAADHQIKWSSEQGTIEQLNSIQLYDTACANVYVNEENEVAYEPWLLTFFTELTDVCQKVGQALKEENDRIEIKPYNLPKEYQDTKAGAWLQKINNKTTSDDVEKNCSWSNTDEQLLNELKQLLGETNPIEKANKLNQIAKNAKSLINKLQELIEKYSDENISKILSEKNEMVVKKKAAEEDALKIFEGSSFEGIGTESWKLLWQHAREFSEKHAYPQFPFPYTGDDSKCVLCHQPLTDDAKQRFINFESYVKGALMKEAEVAEEHFKLSKMGLPEIPTDESIILHLNSIGLTDEIEIRKFIGLLDLSQYFGQKKVNSLS